MQAAVDPRRNLHRGALGGVSYAFLARWAQGEGVPGGFQQRLAW
jgi:hypothetical protein